MILGLNTEENLGVRLSKSQTALNGKLNTLDINFDNILLARNSQHLKHLSLRFHRYIDDDDDIFLPTLYTQLEDLPALISLDVHQMTGFIESYRFGGTNTVST